MANRFAVLVHLVPAFCQKNFENLMELAEEPVVGRAGHRVDAAGSDLVVGTADPGFVEYSVV